MTDQKPTAQDSASNPPAVLIIEANFDDITKAAFKYRQEHVYPYLTARGLNLILLRDGSAQREEVKREIYGANIRYLFGVGHGERDCFCGHRNSPIFRVGEYEQDEVRGKIIHLLSCFTAETLGDDFIRQGAEAFFGYSEDFAIPFEDLDELAELSGYFFGCDAEIECALADGQPIEEIETRVKQRFDDCINELRKLGKREASAALETNRDLLVCLLNKF
ncbi:MAG: hypothetical protein AB7P14_14815 [Blastocatellales bacterium]